MPPPSRKHVAALKERWADDHERGLWYAGGAAYWSNTAATNDGVLGGLGEVHEADTEDSMRFMKRCGALPDSKRNGGDRELRALDVGAGIGRVTGGALLQLADTADLVEECEKFVERARVELAWAAPRVERFICEGMQNFTPEAGRYDLVWIQWCIGCLTDDDLVAFLGRCVAGLKPGGLIVIKDNVIDGPRDDLHLAEGKYLIDHEDNSVMRTMAHLETLLYQRAGLKPLARAEALLGRDDLHPVYNIALQPAAPASAPPSPPAEPALQEEFTFGGHRLRVELTPPADAAEGAMLFDDGELTGDKFDHTGLAKVWPASVVLCRWLADHSAQVAGKRVLELGAGTGLPSLLCARLGARRVVATDGTEAVVERLGRALASADAGGAASRHAALRLEWEQTEVLLATAKAEGIDTLLLADVVYPMKEQAPLLAALASLLAAAPLTILLASTARDPTVHADLERGLHALPGAEVETLCTDASEADPLYGAATVFVYRVAPAKSS